MWNGFQLVMRMEERASIRLSVVEWASGRSALLIALGGNCDFYSSAWRFTRKATAVYVCNTEWHIMDNAAKCNIWVQWSDSYCYSFFHINAFALICNCWVAAVPPTDSSEGTPTLSKRAYDFCANCMHLECCCCLPTYSNAFELDAKVQLLA